MASQDIFEVVRMPFGSRLYGTATPSSDLDIKAVHLPSPHDILLQRAPKVITSQTKSDIREKNGAEDVDFESFSVQHYLKLLMEGQTICLDMLFCPRAYLIKSEWVWEEIRANKDKLLSRQCKSFIGYCRQQASKYGVKGERVAAVRKIVDNLTELGATSNAKVGDFAMLWERLAAGDEFIELIDITLANGTVVRHLSCCNRKAPYTTSIKEACATYSRVLDEYGKRAKAAETNEGVDWKAMSHAVRIGRQAQDLLLKGEVIFPLPYADYLLQIKTGLANPQKVMEEIDELLGQVEDAAARSPLPEHPNYKWAEDFVVECNRGVVLSDSMAKA